MVYIMKRNWLDKKIVILGLSKSGIAAAKYLCKQGAECTISDSKEATEADLKVIDELQGMGISVEMGQHKTETIEDAYLIVTSPGIPPTADIYTVARDNHVQVISEMELAYLETYKPFIAITGTNGKTTTTTLISEILSNGDLCAPACGNIGIPATSLLDEDLDYFIAEISSFQIATSKTFKPQIACYLNYTPDHIYWHGSEEAYRATKESLFLPPHAPVWGVFNACDEVVMSAAAKSPSDKWYFGREMSRQCCYIKDDCIMFKNVKGEESPLINIHEINIFGEHNYQNIMASVIVAKIVGVDDEVIRKTLREFKAPPHRLEFVAKIDGKSYYNDSKATNVDSAVRALEAFNYQSITLIAGGRDKGASLAPFVDAVKKYVNNVVLIGEAADYFEEELKKGGYTSIKKANSMEEAIDLASQLDDEVVLLSPACASFDMFNSFEHRGDVFKNYVLQKLQKS